MTSGACTTARPRLAAGALAAALALGLGATGTLTVPATAAPGPDAPDEPRGELVESAPELRLLPLPGGDLAALDVALNRRAWTVAEPSDLADAPTTTGRMQTSAYSMVGFTWRGQGAEIRVRARSDGRWGQWYDAPELADGPDQASVERRSGQGATEPLWLGASDGIEVQVTGPRPRGFTMALIDPGEDPAAGASQRGPGASTPDAARKKQKPDQAPRPPIRGRRAWNADNSWRDGGPWYNRTIQQVHVHHTASGTSYRKRDVPGLIRGMYRYHTYNLGWSDIGYNFLVDRFGRRWVGRAGGAAKAVRGAHTLGFNSTSVGIGVIGNFDGTTPRQQVLTSLVRLAAWKLDPYDRKARSRVKVYSHGSDKYPEGRKVWLKTIDGHRDTNDTACPGQRLYDRIPGVRRRTAERIKRYS